MIKARPAPLILIAALLLSSCGAIKPWVKPYERQNIADRVMDMNRDPVSESYLSHVHEAREGASGADGAAGGGCGCN